MFQDLGWKDAHNKKSGLGIEYVRKSFVWLANFHATSYAFIQNYEVYDCPLRCAILKLFLRITPYPQKYCSMHKNKIFCEQIFKIDAIYLGRQL